MGDNTKIEWSDASWNPIRGCTMVSKGCELCYAMTQAHRFSGEGQPYEGLTRVSGGRGVWNGKIMLVPEKLNQPLRWERPRKIFVNSMSDLHHENVPLNYVATVYGIMTAARQHQFQVLTKRPQRMLEFFDWLHNKIWPETSPGGYRDFLCSTAATALADGSDGDQDDWFWKLRSMCCPTDWPIPNIWLGTSVEDQETADERVPILAKVPAKIRFLSVEPLLGPLTLPHELKGIQWVIVGGESGPGARPCKEEWVAHIIDQCQNYGVPVFFKQKGTVWALECGAKHPKGGDINDFPEHLKVRQMPV